MNQRKKLTIDDIAVAAGVSKSTVSRYLNGHTELMSSKTWERVHTVVEMTNYEPSFIASNLKKRTSNLIGLLIADISSPFSSALICGVNKRLEEEGYTLLIADNSEDPEKERESLRSLLSKGVSGLLVNTASYTNDALIRTQCSGIPIVLLDRHVRNHNFDIVTTDARECISKLVRHVHDMGYTRPYFFVQEWENNSTRTKRREAFLEAMAEIYHYDAIDDIYELRSDGPTPSECVKEIVSRPGGEVPVAIGANSITTVRVFHVARELGIRIPEELGLCGPEDWDWVSELNWPMLVEPHVTTVKIPATAIGERAADLLIQKLQSGEDETPQEIFLPCEFTARDSTLRTST
jgi:HTH-type transcriptional regulator kdgR (kdg operon repressor)